MFKSQELSRDCYCLKASRICFINLINTTKRTLKDYQRNILHHLGTFLYLAIWFVPNREKHDVVNHQRHKNRSNRVGNVVSAMNINFITSHRVACTSSWSKHRRDVVNFMRWRPRMVPRKVNIASGTCNSVSLQIGTLPEARHADTIELFMVNPQYSLK
jgi:hypothetical protein